MEYVMLCRGQPDLLGGALLPRARQQLHILKNKIKK
jgi:hypothetical protein